MTMSSTPGTKNRKAGRSASYPENANQKTRMGSPGFLNGK